MGLSKEIFGPKGTEVSFFNVNLGSSERKVNIFPTKETGVETRIRELSHLLLAKSKRGEEKEDRPQKETRTNGFEPFVNPQPSENPLFINGYAGNFAQRMEFNKRGIERVLKIAHLDGKVTLFSLNASRQRSVEANPDGSVVRKRSLFWGEKIKEADKENPFRRVVPTPQGWRIEINDTRIREELEKKNLTGRKLQSEFIRQFNIQLNSAVFESIRKEKMTSIKDEFFLEKVLTVVIPLF